jgi:hypothetical protein
MIRMLLDRRMVMCRRGSLIDRHPVTAHFRSTVRHRTAICRRPTLTGRHPDAAGTGRHLVICHRRTLRLPPTVRHRATVHHGWTSHHRMLTGRLPAMARLPVRRQAWTSRLRTLTGRRRAMAHPEVPSTVRHHGLLSLRRTQFRGRARMLAA